MKNKKIISTLLMVFAVAFTSCGGPTHVHEWSEATYVWNSDYTKCTASRVCTLDSSHIETEICNTVYTVITPATIDSTGVGRYTANFVNSGFVSQTHEKTIDKLSYTVIENISKRMPAEFEPVSMVKMCSPNNMHLSEY